MAKHQTVTLGKIVDYKGTAYGPGTITVPKDVADIFVKYFDAQPGAVSTDEAEPPAPAKPAAEDLSTDELKRLLAEREGTKSPEVQAPAVPEAQAATAPAEPQAQPSAAAEGSQPAQVAPAASEPADVPKGGLPAGFPGRAKLIAAGITTLAKLKEAGKDGLPKSIEGAERDQVLAELATIGE